MNFCLKDSSAKNSESAESSDIEADGPSHTVNHTSVHTTTKIDRVILFFFKDAKYSSKNTFRKQSYFNKTFSLTLAAIF